MCVVLLLELRPWWSYRNRSEEFGTATWEELVVGRGTRQGETDVEVVAVTVADDEILPVLQHISLVRELCRQLEVVVRPAQTLAPSHGNSEELHILVGVEIVLVVIVV